MKDLIKKLFDLDLGIEIEIVIKGFDLITGEPFGYIGDENSDRYLYPFGRAYGDAGDFQGEIYRKFPEKEVTITSKRKSGGCEKFIEQTGIIPYVYEYYTTAPSIEEVLDNVEDLVKSGIYFVFHENGEFVFIDINSDYILETKSNVYSK